MVKIRYIKTQAQKDRDAAMAALKKENKGLLLVDLKQSDRELLLGYLLMDKFGLIE